MRRASGLFGKNLLAEARLGRPLPYTEAEQRAGQNAMVLEGVFSRAMEGVTGGVILAGFALALGASDLEIGLIAAIPFLAQLAHIPAIAILERFPDRKALTFWASAASRTLFGLMAAAPFVSLPLRPVHALVPLLVGYAVLATIGSASWQVWVRELVPRASLGRYFGRRMAVLSAVGLVTIVAAGQFVSWHASRWPGEDVRAFSILFASGLVFGVTSSLLMRRAPSRPTRSVHDRGFRERIKAPFRDRNYRRLLAFLGAWGFAANIALPFMSVVLLRVLGYGLGTVTAIAAVSQIANVVGLRLWAPLTDRFGNKPVMGLGAAVFLVAMLAWTLTPKEVGATVLVVAVVVHWLLGFALAALDVSANGVVLKLAPEDMVPSFLASASVVKAVAAGVAPLLGGLAAMLLAGREYRVQLAWTAPDGGGMLTAIRLGPYDLLFAASVVLGLYAVHRLLGFHEEGEAPPETVMRAMRRDVGQVSSVAGMRTFAHMASYVVEVAYRFERALGPRDGDGKR